LNYNFVLVPARGGSKGLINKNLTEVHGKTLTNRSITHARKIVDDKQIILSTDSEDIVLEAAKFFKIKSYDLELNNLSDFGPFKVHFRDSSLSSDNSLISEVIFSVRNLILGAGKSLNVICLLQPTSPFRSSKDLSLIKKIVETSSTNSSVVSVCSVRDMHPARMYRLNTDSSLVELGGFTEFRYNRRQDLPELYIRDGGFYIIGDSLIVEKLQYSSNPMSLIRSFPWSINIDGREDLIIAKAVEKFEVKDDPNEH
jgi:CMP-N,N'-diacetyllegionaminic acid synthase